MSERVRGLDAAFLALESEASQFHVAQACVFDAATSPYGHSFERVRQLIEDRIDRLPPFRRRLVESPLGLAPPTWIEDPNFDLDLHLHPVRLLPPAGLRQLADFSGEFISGRLDRRQPLWDMAVVEGLDDDLSAGVTKIHHAAVDGISGAELTANLLDLTPDIAPRSEEESTWRPDRYPSTRDRIRTVAEHQLRLPADTARGLGRLAAAAFRVARHNRSPGVIAPPAPFSAPRTPFDTEIGTRRKVAFTRLDLSEIKAVRKAFHVTVNDVLLAASSSALRHLLDGMGALPERDLVAAVPVSVRDQQDQPGVVNQLSNMLVSLATAEADPKARLAAIAFETQIAKEQDRVLGPTIVAEVAGMVTPLMGRAIGQLAALTGVMHRPRPLVNAVISTYPGPPIPLYCAGATLVAPYPMGPVIDGAPINITAQSYLDGVYVGVVVDADTGPDPWVIADGIQDGLTELAKLTA